MFLNQQNLLRMAIAVVAVVIIVTSVVITKRRPTVVSEDDIHIAPGAGSTPSGPADGEDSEGAVASAQSPGASAS
jgi:hypothetical protein